MNIQDQDRISGKSLLGIFDSLLKNRIILKLHILGQGYEGLSIVTGVDNSNSKPTFLLDYPSGVQDIFQDSVGKKVFFEYSGTDKLHYSFRAFISGVEGDDIRFQFPEAVERIQRRKHFRVAPPIGTTMGFKIRDKRYECSLVNISESGAMVNDRSANYNKSIFFYGGELLDLQITCEEEQTRTNFLISKAEIVRLEKKMEKGCFHYALKFVEMNKRDQEMLKTFIYNCQREELRKRSRFSET